MLYEVKLGSGRVVAIDDPEPEHACLRAADLYGEPAVAWRTPRVGVYQYGRGDRIIQ